MSKFSASVWALAIVFCAFGVGCGDSGPSVPDSPDGTVLAISKGLTEGKPEILWAMLPPSYQKDVNDLKKEFADKVDTELYDKGFTIARKALSVLKAKKDFILENKMLFMMTGMNKDKVSRNWDKVISLGETLINSDLNTVASLKALDVAGFLRGTGAKLMKQGEAISAMTEKDPYANEFLAEMKNIKVAVVSSEGDKAILKITTPGEGAQEETFMKVEGRWVPRRMAAEWQDSIAEAREALASMDKAKFVKNKAKIMGVMAMVETTLDELAKADTAEKFNTLVGELMGSF